MKRIVSLGIVSILEKNYHDLDFTKVYKQLYQSLKVPSSSDLQWGKLIITLKLV